MSEDSEAGRTAAGAAPAGGGPGHAPPRWAWWVVGVVIPLAGVLATVLAAQQRTAPAAPGAPPSDVRTGGAAPAAPTPAPSPAVTPPASGTPGPDPWASPAAPTAKPPAPAPAATPGPSATSGGGGDRDTAAKAEGLPVGVPVRIVNRNSGFCLAVPGASTEVVALNQFGCGNFPDHFWRVEPWGRGGAGPVYRVVNDNSGFCAAVPAADRAAGVVVNQFPCGDYPDHLWRLDRDGSDDSGRPLYRVVNDNSGLCLTVAGADTRQAAAVVQAPCGSRPERQWRLTAR
ncbi:RICIN domain-containing protein [Streptomyces sp. NPDC058734]|uniref:RICIN domain-containing protein n=1 Tax=Streptomyces sp. NPDC058734 TaxID=3346615 RepID=UPI00369ED55D